MIRLSKLADYGIVVLSVLSRSDMASAPARALADAAHLPLPTVHKVLKSLRRAGLIVSQRGARGGYRLARPPEAVAVADIIAALEGPVAMTECSPAAGSACAIEVGCPVRQGWRRIDAVVAGALAELTLSDMQQPLPAPRRRGPTTSARS